MGILVCLNVFLMKFLFYWILTGMGMREGCPIKCIGYSGRRFIFWKKEM